MTEALLTAPDNKVDDGQIQEWIAQFHRNGFLVLHDILTGDHVAELKADLDRILQEPQDGDQVPWIRERMFEKSAANLRLFDLEPIVTIAEKMVEATCHVIHNNSFVVAPGGGITGWHQDDPPHYIVTEGEPPTNVHLPVLFFTANYYLTDVPDPSYGPTEAIPGSHLFGKPCPGVIEGTQWEEKIVPCVGRAGSVVLFNNQVWHRGGPNQSDRTRYMAQVTYGRRIINHMFYPFMNYQMPEHVYRDASPRLKRLLGFLPRGNYG